MTARRFLQLSDAGSTAITAMLDEAIRRKQARAGQPKGAVDADAPLAGHVLAMVFEKPSTRTRLSFDLAIRQLGGSSLALDGATSQLGRGESFADTARVLARYADAVVIRTGNHAHADELADMAEVPVINGLTELSHPCQLLADMMTVIERRGTLAGSRWAWLGDGNNVCNSLIEAAALMDFDLVVATPNGFEADITMAAMASTREGIFFTENPRDALDGADVVVTDTWCSMGVDEDDYRRECFTPFCIDEAALARAAPDAIFLHCLPAHRGEEVVDAVIDGSQSAVWDEAENRLHAQKALLLWLFGRIG